MSEPSEYRLQYLPLFWDDLRQAATYISTTLQNPAAARKLVDDVEAAVLKQLQTPTAAAVYKTTRARPLPYYWLKVGNYMVFYVVFDDVMEVRRLIYGPRNLEGMLP